MPLPTRDQVQTTDYSLRAQPAVFLEAKSLSSATLDYSEQAQPVYGLAPSSSPAPSTSTNFFLMFNYV